MAIYLTNAMVYRGAGRFDEASTVVISGAKIKSVGAASVPAGARRGHFELLHSAYSEWLAGPVSAPGKRPQPPDNHQQWPIAAA